ncbi:unnamed protein product [Rotaria sordida]|uniref:MULE transposase domain-containing protein n=1 Tax=Rotaria sordida TaxID=392033 RepID=A0A819D8L9_9BILA|nr:unnamed protein product [Rotaria sordida]
MQISISFLKSNKGKTLLLLNQYLFKCNKTTHSKKYWTCIERGCGVSVQTDLNDQFLLINGDHNHVVNPDLIEVKVLKEKMKHRILTETTSLTQIYDQDIANAKLSEATAAQFPTVIEYRSNMSKTRRKITPVIPTSCVFEIPTPYQETLSQKRFLLMDFFLKRGKERVIVYSTNQQLHLLFNSEEIFIDGTFHVAPGGFEQVFLIHVHHFGQGLPVVFCLMPNRRAATYSELFQRLKQEATAMGKQFEPRRIISDFEAALIPVIRQEFPTATHTGCMFHFNQNIHRKIMGLGLGTDYAQDASIREQCKQLMALCLMPISEVEYQFKRIRTIASPSLDDLFTYFYRQWIDGNVPLSMWNFYDLNHRTNNICEGSLKNL